MESLSKTWFVDIDGTIFHHKTIEEIDKIISNIPSKSYLAERPITSAIEFFKNLPKKDKIIITTAREKRHIEHTVKALRHFGMPFDDYLFELGSGARIVVNDIKPPGAVGNKDPLKTAYGLDVERDVGIVKEHYTEIDKIDKPYYGYEQ